MGQIYSSSYYPPPLHTAIFNVGKDTFILDGKEKPLGYKLYTTDGIPMFDFELLSDAFGFEHEWQEKVLTIKAPQSCVYDPEKLSDHDFIFTSNLLQGWSSPLMALMAGEDHLTAKTTVYTRDPQMYRYGTNFSADEHKVLKLCIRYQFAHPAPQDLEIFFDTKTARGFCAERCIRIPLNVNNTAGEWREYTVDLTQINGWTGIVTDLRLDPFMSTGTMEFKYTRFLEK